MSKQSTFDSEKFQKSLDAFGQALNEVMMPIVAGLNAAIMEWANSVSKTLIQEFLKIDWNKLDIVLTLNNPERYEGESFSDWGCRLERAGLFDKFEYRIMYGNECWRALLHSPIWLVGLAWEWLRGLWAKN